MAIPTGPAFVYLIVATKSKTAFLSHCHLLLGVTRTFQGVKWQVQERCIHVRATVSDTHFVYLKKNSLEDRKQVCHFSQALAMLWNYFISRIIASMKYLCALIIGKQFIFITKIFALLKWRKKKKQE